MFTIGYAGKTLAEFVAALLDAGVERVVDVRALPLSSRKGFSKTALGTALAKKGIEYVHLRSAGNPYRDKKHDIEHCLALYSGHLDENPSVLEEVDAVLAEHRAALLCVEAEAGQCHRGVLAERLRQRDPNRGIRHL
jgi:uncharacterized protein (DUF488 family)